MIITGTTTIDELAAELRRRGVANLSTWLQQMPDAGASVGCSLHALAGSSGHAHSSTVVGSTLAQALDKLCQDLDDANVIRVKDHLGRLRGRYENTPGGRRLAEAHMRSLGKGASIA
jgi:hypothetical protein